MGDVPEMVERVEQAMRRHRPRRETFREMANLKAAVRRGEYDNCHMAAAMRMTLLGAALASRGNGREG